MFRPAAYPQHARPVSRHHKQRIALAIATLLMLQWLPGSPLQAQSAPGVPPPKVMVSGAGETALSPDMALITLNVLREAASASEALTQNNQAMAAVIAAMKRNEIAERDMQTSGFSINPRYVYPSRNSGETQQPKIIGYTVSNALTVRVRDLNRLGEVLDTSVRLGVNQGGNITFTNDDPSQALREARIEAVKDAMEKAKTLTEAAGIRLGRVLEIDEQSHEPAPMPMMQATRSAGIMAAEAVPVQRGENTYRVNVQLSFELLQ